MNCVWSDVERDFIREHASTMTDSEISVKLSEISKRDITLQAVRKQRQKMKLRKLPGRGKCLLAGVSAKPKPKGMGLLIRGRGGVE